MSGAAEVPRIAPLPEEEWDDEVRAALRAAFSHEASERFLSKGPDGMRAPNAVTTLLRHPRLAGPWLAYNGVLLFDGELEPRLRELAILRVAWRTRAPYEWAQHVRLATRLGFTADDFAVVAREVIADTWTPLEADLLAATDELLARHRIEDATWARLAEHLDERQLVELVFVVGTYTTLAMAFNSFGIQLDPDLDAGARPGSEA